MRAKNFIQESAADELARRLPNLAKHDYDTIDRLMQRIGRRHKLSGKKLHDIFVHKYGHSPDHWVKQIKNRLSEVDTDPTDDDSMGYMKYFNKPQEPNKPKEKVFRGWDEYEKDKEQQKVPSDVTESVDSDEDMQKIKDFIAWSMKTLDIEGDPKFTFSKDTEAAQEGHHTGVHSGDDIWVYVGNRNLIDIFRTIFHELVHQRQHELGMIQDGDSYPGSPIEMMADMVAGKYIKIYGKQHPEIFQ